MNDLIDSFCSDPLRRRLYEEVRSHTPIVFIPSNDIHWGSKTQNGQTTIYHAAADYPEACLAHELLHAKVKCNGYKQYTVFICGTSKKDTLAYLLETLDNELQHHKFYREFLDLGFEASQLYADSDKDVWTELRSAIAKRSQTDPLEAFLTSYVTIIAPGGVENKSQRREAERRLRKRSPPGQWERIISIGNAITRFGDNTSLDAGPTVAEILKTLGGYEPTWIGWSEQFPGSGLFVGKPFTVDGSG
jgi:hypothetical protein